MCLIAIIIYILHPVMVDANWKNSGNLKVAVLDLLSRVDKENIDVITLTEMLQASLADKKAFQIVERSMLSKILEEQKLSMSGLTEKDASKVGALAGAQKIITGSISRMGNRYILIVKGIDTETGVVELTDQAMIPDIDGLMNAIPLVAERIAKKAMGETPRAAQVLQETAQPGESILLEERFADNRNGWGIGDWDAASAVIKGGQYIISMKKQIPVFYSKIDLAMSPAKNFSVEATVAKLSGDEGDPASAYYGIIFGKDFKNQYEFCVHPAGRYMIRRQVNGETTFIQSSIIAPWVNRGNTSNTFKIVKKGDMIVFYLNGHMLNEERGNLLISNVNLIGYTTWRTPGENLRIAGKNIMIRLIE
jgi:TolB-like protein